MVKRLQMLTLKYIRKGLSNMKKSSKLIILSVITWFNLIIVLVMLALIIAMIKIGNDIKAMQAVIGFILSLIVLCCLFYGSIRSIQRSNIRNQSKPSSKNK